MEMNGSFFSKAIVVVVAIIIVGTVMFGLSQLGESLTPKPTVDAELTINRDKFKTTESAKMTLYLKNNEDTNKVEVTSSEKAKYGQGIPVEPKACYENLEYCQGAYFVICDTGETADVRVEEDISKE